MKRFSWLTGVLVAVGVAVLITPDGAAQGTERRTPTGLGPDGTVHAAMSGGSATADDVPDIEWPPPGTTPPKQQEWGSDDNEGVIEDGSLVLAELAEWRGDWVRHIRSVLHYRTDGTVVTVSAYDYDPIFDGDEGPDRDEVALSVEQLTALATDPALHL